MMRLILRHRLDAIAAVVFIVLLLWAATLAGCAGLTVAGVPDSNTTLRHDTTARTLDATTATLAASVAVGTVDGAVVTLQEGTPVLLPPGAGVTLNAGTPVTLGWIEALVWLIPPVVILIGGAFAVRWAWRRFGPKEATNADD